MQDDQQHLRTEPPELAGSLKTLKNWAALVYLCQVLAFGFYGLTVLLGLAINIYKRQEVSGTWLESHFNWQVKTAYVALALTAVSGLTLAFGIGLFIFAVTAIWMVYRIALGWYALIANQEIK